MSTQSCGYVVTQSCSNAVDKIMRIQVSKSSINVKTKICGGGMMVMTLTWLLVPDGLI